MSYPRILGNPSLTRFDVIVVGSGSGGSATAAVLAENGLKVLILEAGSNYFEGLDDPDPTKLRTLFSNDELKMVRRGFIMPDERVDPRTFRTDGNEDADFVGDVNHLPKTVGGGAVHADLKTPRFLPFDFRLGSLLGSVSGANFADWPVDYDMLEPFYDYCERQIGVQGVAGANPFEGPRRNPFPMPPGVPMYLGIKASDAARRLGYHPFPYPSAVNSRPYGGRPACVDCGFCGEYGCAISAKGSPAVTLLRKALLTGNCLLLAETKVTRLRYAGGSRRIIGVDALDPDGRAVSYSADRYVLAASPIENSRILFLSDPRGPGLGNSTGLVGRNLMFHFQTIVIGIFEERLHGHRGRTVSHGMGDFRGVPGDPDRPLGGIVEFGSAGEPIREALLYSEMLSMGGTFLKSLMEQSPLRDRILAFTMQAEDAPQLSNRIDLDPSIRDLDGLPVPRVTYANHDFELRAREFYSPKLLDLMGETGAKYGFVAPSDERPSSRHILGTLRFGSDPKTSVCDPTGRFHEIENLYASDGSLMPTSAGYNPTLTIMALGAWVGASLVKKSSPESALRERITSTSASL